MPADALAFRPVLALQRSQALRLVVANMTTPACVHWWMLPTPSGPTIMGVCKYCGAEREFASGSVAMERSDFTKDAHLRPAEKINVFGLSGRTSWA